MKSNKIFVEHFMQLCVGLRLCFDILRTKTNMPDKHYVEPNVGSNQVFVTLAHVCCCIKDVLHMLRYSWKSLLRPYQSPIAICAEITHSESICSIFSCCLCFPWLPLCIMRVPTLCYAVPAFPNVVFTSVQHVPCLL